MYQIIFVDSFEDGQSPKGWNQSLVYVTFFDTKKAFDTVWIDGLFYMLYVRGVRGKLWRLLRSAYMDCLCAVLLGGKLSS